MCRTTATRTVTVVSPSGLHLRAASTIAETVGRYEAKVVVAKGSHRVDAANVLQVISLIAYPGAQLVLEAHGNDAADVLDELERLFANDFNVKDSEKKQET